MAIQELPTPSVLDQQLLSPGEVTKLIPGLKTKLLAEWRYRKCGPRFFKVGRIILYAREDIDAWFAGLAVDGDEGHDHR